MTFAEITALRIEMAAEYWQATCGTTTSSHTQEAPEPAEWQQFCLRELVDDDKTGVTYQRCGGGRRVIRKKIGGD